MLLRTPRKKYPHHQRQIIEIFLSHSPFFQPEMCEKKPLERKWELKGHCCGGLSKEDLIKPLLQQHFCPHHTHPFVTSFSIQSHGPVLFPANQIDTAFDNFITTSCSSTIVCCLGNELKEEEKKGTFVLCLLKAKIGEKSPFLIRGLEKK